MFYVHASKKYDRSAPQFLQKLFPESSCKLGFIIGTVTLLDVIKYSYESWERDSHLHLCQWTEEELNGAILESSDYGFILVDPKPIEPIPAKGSLNFWNFG